MKVLIADDSDLVRERLSAMIAEVEGAELVAEATNGQEALEAIQQLQPDVVVLDIRMPGGNGIQVLESIKTKEAPPVVIMLTAFPYPQYRNKCLEAGADYFLDKTTEFEQIAQVLRQLQQNIPAAGDPGGGADRPAPG